MLPEREILQYPKYYQLSNSGNHITLVAIGPMEAKPGQGAHMRHGGPILPSTSLGEPLAPSFSPRLFPTLATLWNESKIFARLMYKNRHQHRAALYYRKFQKLLRDMKALVRLEIVLQQQYERGGLGKEDTRELFKCVPVLCRQLKRGCQTSYKLLEESYSEGYFVPLTMTAMALIARVNALLDVILDQELPLATSKLSL